MTDNAFVNKDSKRLKVVVGVNTLTAVDQAVYSNHCQFWYRLGRSMQDFDFMLINPRRMSIDNMRNTAAKIAIENNADYLLFIDDDVLVPLDTLPRLLAANADIAAGWTLIRGYPFKNMFFRFADETKTNLENYPDDSFKYDDNGNIPCDAVGFSCALIKVDLLKKIEVPYFVTGPYNTEDIYFCLKARSVYSETSIVVDPRVLTSHNIGAEYLDPLGRAAYKEYFEKMEPQAKEMVEKPQKFEKKHDEPSDGPTYEDVLAKAVFGK